MQQAIVKDILFLQQKSEVAVKSDLYLTQDLQDTLLANQDNCVGLAANMIGVKKRVIIFMYGWFQSLCLTQSCALSQVLIRQRKLACLLLVVDLQPVIKKLLSIT